MTKPTYNLSLNVSRRRFLQTSAALAGATAMTQLRTAHGAGADALGEVRIGLVGCGGRGTGALLDALGAATKVIYPQLGYHTEDVAEGASVEKKDIKVAALADLFPDRLEQCKKQIEKLGINVPANRCFTGFDACGQLLALSDVNYVILATPPRFRAEQLEAAVKAGKHVFMEKPVAVDVPGVLTVMAAGEAAREKGLGIAAGTQRRHLKDYQETIQRIRDGAIGEIVYARCYWNGGEIWVIPREEGWSDIEWQIRNWNYFTWLSGDHYVEQHVHNLDIMNWVFGTHPVKAISGIGGRQVRTAEVNGYIFDHFAVEFEYPDGQRMFSQARQINGCQNKVEEAVVGTQGESNCRDWIVSGGDRWRFRGEKVNPYRQEHEDLIASVRAGEPINEAQAIAEATMTGILGREAAYSGKEISWEEAMKSTTRLGPEKLQFGDYPIQPVAMPGKYKFS
ncbi:MAG: Gfo/Idh/MocA family oxidoreductase [Planctomycetaceae bacterium]|nr:Gfo/Idh/MocA family oxidoreductase [Planctomycetaceae bacterium]